MFSQESIQTSVDFLVRFSTDYLMPFMVLCFVGGVALRVLNWYSLKRQEFFVTEFKKRVDRYLDSLEQHKGLSFFVVAKHWLMVTFYEIFEVRALLQRRKMDPIMSWSDRVFLTKMGFAWLVKDVLRKVRNLKYQTQQPRLHEISRNSFETNPCFTNVFGVIPTGLTNDLLNMLPGLFIVGGIFGTFLGITKALPTIGDMNLNDVEGTKLVMDQFLLKVSFSMSTSIVGIVLSVAMSVVNAMFSAEKIFLHTVEVFENALYAIWHKSDNNDLPIGGLDFDENKNPVEALAEKSLEKELEKLRGKSDQPRGPGIPGQETKKAS